MGLIADYVEANRERASIGDVDPCMIANSSHALRFSYHALHETMRAYSSLNDGGQRDALEKELRRRIVELDRVKTQYILSEKAILEVLNRSQLKSPMMLESLRELCDQIRVAYESVCGVLQELNEHMGSKSQYQAPNVEEKAVRRRLLELLSGMVGFMNNDATMDTSASERWFPIVRRSFAFWRVRHFVSPIRTWCKATWRVAFPFQRVQCDVRTAVNSSMLRSPIA